MVGLLSDDQSRHESSPYKLQARQAPVRNPINMTWAHGPEHLVTGVKEGRHQREQLIKSMTE